MADAGVVGGRGGSDGAVGDGDHAIVVAADERRVPAHGLDVAALVAVVAAEVDLVADVEGVGDGDEDARDDVRERRLTREAEDEGSDASEGEDLGSGSKRVLRTVSHVREALSGSLLKESLEEVFERTRRGVVAGAPEAESRRGVPTLSGGGRCSSLSYSVSSSACVFRDIRDRSTV